MIKFLDDAATKGKFITIHRPTRMPVYEPPPILVGECLETVTPPLRVTRTAAPTVTRNAFDEANDAVLKPQVAALKGLLKKRTNAARQAAYRARKRAQNG